MGPILRKIIGIGSIGIFGMASICDKMPDPDPNSPDPFGRYLFAANVEEDAEEETVQQLLALLGDPHAMPREGALVGLARIRRTDLAAHAVQKLRDPADTVRAQACRTVGILIPEEGLSPLTAMVCDQHENARVRLESVRALKAYGARDKVLEALWKALQVSEDSAGSIGAITDGSVAVEAHLTLVHLTGHHPIDPTYEGWKPWFATHPNP
jgi:HEAT repeat protein